MDALTDKHALTDKNALMGKQESDSITEAGFDQGYAKREQAPGTGNKWKYTLITTVVFLIIANPFTYKWMDRLLQNIGVKVANSNGCPTLVGLLIHALVFTLILRYMMDLPI